MPILLHVLILEDRPDDAQLMAHELRRANFEPVIQRVETEKDYMAALNPTLDLILADYSLPDFDGLLALQLLQQRGLDIPFILVSGTIGEELAVEAMKRGAADYLLKDRLARLGPAVEHVLEQKRLRDEMRQAEMSLRQNEARYRAFIANSSEGIWWIEAKRPISTYLPEDEQIDQFFAYSFLVECNDALARMHGQEEAGDLMGVQLEAFLTRSDPRNIELLRTFIRHGYRLIDMESYRIDSEGDIHIFMNNVVGFVENNHLIRAWGVQQDITERKQSEEVIRRRNHELAMLNQIISASAADLGPEAILKIACRELALNFGSPQVAAALLNEQETEVVVVAEYRAEDRSSALNQVIPVLDNPLAYYMFTHKTPLVIDNAQSDPRLVMALPLLQQRGKISMLILPLIIGGKVVGGLGMDTAESRLFSPEEVSLAWSVADQVAGALARARLTQTQQRLITAIEQAGENVIITDTRGIILYVNSAFERTTGYSRAEVMGRNPRLLKSGQQDLAFYQNLWTIITSGQVWRGRVVNKKKDGTLYTEEGTITPVCDDTGVMVNFVAVKRDVTGELHLEEQFRQAQKMEAVGRLAGGVAHDFNNLLTVINGYSEILLNRRLAADHPGRRDVEQIIQSGEQAARLTGQLLAFSRKQMLHLEVLDLNSIIANIEKMLGRLIGEDINIVTLLDPHLGQIKADRGQLEQVIVNLAINARDAMPEGGTLTFETTNVVLDEAYAGQQLEVEPGPYVLLTVRDTGIGMDKTTLSHIFEPFFTTKPQGKGTGLGLATVHGIIKQSGGHIEVYSEWGQGATFKIYLPRLDQEIDPLEPALTWAKLPQGTETILVVEDEVWVRELVATILKDNGYSVLKAANGTEALHLYVEQQEPIHLLLTDVIMPDINGRELAERLTSLQPSLKVLYMSGYTDDALGHHGVLEATVAFIPKPLTAAALLCKVREILDMPGSA